MIEKIYSKIDGKLLHIVNRFDYIKTRTDIFLQARYEYINNIYLNSSLTLMQTTLANGNLVNDNTYQLGISVGLP